MMMEKKEKMLREAIHQHYQCNGKYACSERAYCWFCDGENIAHDCDDECFADEFSEGFLAGWDSALKSQWVSVDERLPELKERVLVAQRGINRISVCIMKRIPHDSSNPDNKKWHWSLTNNKDEVIAWKPLPHFDEVLLKELLKERV